MKTAYIIYSSRSCETGVALFNHLKVNRTGGYRWRRSNKKPPSMEHDLCLRWGNSRILSDATEINSIEAVRKASNKKEMISILKNHSLCPSVLFLFSTTQQETIRQYSNKKGNVFVRDRKNNIRYCHYTEVKSTDLYVIQPISKAREFRVHVVDNKVLGVYEKVPNTENTVIRKNDNCDFVRLDMSNEEVREKNKRSEG